MVHYANIGSPFLVLLESDHSLVYATVHLSSRLVPIKKKKEHQGDSDDVRLMTHPDLQHQVASAKSAALPPLPSGTCISEIVVDMADLMLFISYEVAPHSKHPREPQSLCLDPDVKPDVKADMNVAW